MDDLPPSSGSINGWETQIAPSFLQYLVNRQVEADTEEAFLDGVLAYAGGFCPPHKASMAVGHIKRAVQSGLVMPLEQGLALERELQAKLFSSADAKEGISAFVEKRKPAFEGQ